MSYEDYKNFARKMSNLYDFAIKVMEKAETRSLVYSYEIKELADKYLKEDGEGGVRDGI